MFFIPMLLYLFPSPTGSANVSATASAMRAMDGCGDRQWAYSARGLRIGSLPCRGAPISLVSPYLFVLVSPAGTDSSFLFSGLGAIRSGSRASRASSAAGGGFNPRVAPLIAPSSGGE
jgi:hypothetical protein